MQQHVKVFARIRPSVHIGEIINSQTLSFDRQTVTVCSPFTNPRSFVLDGVYGPDATATDIYDASLADLLVDFLDGRSCTYFVYGQTGSGKTHTIGFTSFVASGTSNGSEDQRPMEADGLCGLLFHQLFQELQHGNHRYNFTSVYVLISMVQIYNDEVDDLLFPSQKLELREIDGSFRLINATKVAVSATIEAMKVISYGLKNRVIAPTLMNRSSSRSHTILRIALCQQTWFNMQQPRPFLSSSEYFDLLASNPSVMQLELSKRRRRAVSANSSLTSKSSRLSQLSNDQCNILLAPSTGELQSFAPLSVFSQGLSNGLSRGFVEAHDSEVIFYLCDLAGSERNKESRSGGFHLAEAAHINQSLSALGNVVSALSRYAQTGVATHIPYRNSLLTKLLQSSLAGEARTVVTVTISPAVTSLGETLSTLIFAERCKSLLYYTRPKAVTSEKGLQMDLAALSEEDKRLIVSEYLSARGLSLSWLEKHLSDVRSLSGEIFEKKNKCKMEMLVAENVRLKACLKAIIGSPELPLADSYDTKRSDARSTFCSRNTTHIDERLYLLLTSLFINIDQLYRCMTKALFTTGADIALRDLAALCTTSFPQTPLVNKQLSQSNSVLQRKTCSNSKFSEGFSSLTEHSELLHKAVQMVHQSEEVVQTYLTKVLASHSNYLFSTYDTLAAIRVVPPFSYFRSSEKLVCFLNDMSNTIHTELDQLKNLFVGKQAEINVTTAYANLILAYHEEYMSIQQEPRQNTALKKVPPTNLSPPPSPSFSSDNTDDLSYVNILSGIPSRPESVDSGEDDTF